MKKSHIIILLLSLSFAGCTKFFSSVFENYSGNGVITSEVRPSDKFQSIKLEGAYDVTITQGPTSQVRIETDKNLLPHITTSVSNGKLTVSSEGNLQPTKNINVFITSPNYHSIEVEGSSDVRSTSTISSDELSLLLEGSGSFALGVEAKTLKSDIEGSGTITLTGSAQDHSMEIDGSGDLHSDSLVVNTAKINISGSGDASLNVLSQLDASINGSGGVRYRGPVTNVHTSISGSGSVDRASDTSAMH
jgi:hypothetical protein